MLGCQGRLIIALLILVFFFAVWLSYSIGINRKYEIFSSSNCTKELPKPSLHELGMRFRTDKSYGHHYDVMYERYLKQYRGQNFTLLEIGLGCGTPLGVGASADLWRAYFGAQANIHIIEIDKACSENWLAKGGSKVSRMHIVVIGEKIYALFSVNRLCPSLTDCVGSTNRWDRIHGDLDILSTSHVLYNFELIFHERCSIRFSIEP
jgi:hypothetical protein